MLNYVQPSLNSTYLNMSNSTYVDAMLNLGLTDTYIPHIV